MIDDTEYEVTKGQVLVVQVLCVFSCITLLVFIQAQQITEQVSKVSDLVKGRTFFAYPESRSEKEIRAEVVK